MDSESFTRIIHAHDLTARSNMILPSLHCSAFRYDVFDIDELLLGLGVSFKRLQPYICA